MVLAPDDSEAGLDETHVLANLTCGTVVVEATSETRGRRDLAEMWLVGLHDGTAFGLTGEVIVSLVGLTPLVLAWSGILIWVRRRAARAWVRRHQRAVHAA